VTVTADYYLIVNDIPLDTYGWQVIEGGYDDLLNTPALRGSDLVMPQAAGVRPYPRVKTVTAVSISMMVVGELDEDGMPIADPVVGMFTHRDYLAENLGIAEDGDPTTGTVPAVWVRGASLPEMEGEVTVLGINDWRTFPAGFAVFRLDLLIPDAEFSEAGAS
jgi:hypothetical protein